MNDKVMKRIKFLWSLLLLGTMATALCACSNDDEVPAPDNDAAQQGYWYHEQFIALHESDLPYVLVVANSKSTDDFKEQVEKLFVTDYHKGRYLIRKSDLGALPDCYVSPIYQTDDGSHLIILPHVTLVLEEGFSLKDVIPENLQSLILSREGSKLTLDVSSSAEVLAFIEQVHSVEGIERCEPDMLIEIKLL